MDDKNTDTTKTLLIRGKRITVTTEIYQAYYQCKEREDYLSEVAAAKEIPLVYIGRVSKHYAEYEILDDHTLSPEETLIAAEEAEEKASMIRKMFVCIEKLSEQEKFVVIEKFIKGKSEREISKATGIPQTTINYQKNKILRKLRDLMDK